MKTILFVLFVSCFSFVSYAQETIPENNSNVEAPEVKVDNIEVTVIEEKPVVLANDEEVELQSCIEQYSRTRRKRAKEQITLYQLLYNIKYIKSRITLKDGYPPESNIDDELYANGLVHCKILKTKELHDGWNTNNKRQKRS